MNPKPEIPTWVYDFKPIIEYRQSQGYQFYVNGTFVSDALDIVLALMHGHQVHAILPNQQNIQIGWKHQ